MPISVTEAIDRATGTLGHFAPTPPLALQDPGMGSLRSISPLELRYHFVTSLNMPTPSSYKDVDIPTDADLWEFMFERPRDDPFPQDKGARWPCDCIRYGT